MEHWSNSTQFLSVGIVGDFELVGQAKRQDVLVDSFAHQKFVVEGALLTDILNIAVPRTPRSTLPAAEADTFCGLSSFLWLKCLSYVSGVRHDDMASISYRRLTLTPSITAVTLGLVSLRQLMAATLAWAKVSSAIMASENNFSWGRIVGSCSVFEITRFCYWSCRSSS